MILAAGPWQLEVNPEVGGSVRSLAWAGIPVLAADDTASDPVLAAGCFAMLPFANRIRDGLVRLPAGASRTVTPGGVADPAHPLHGIGWLRPWQVEPTDPSDGVLLKLVHPGDPAWPWPFQAFLSFRVSDAAFTSTLMLANTGSGPIPASIGFHPWFPAATARFSTRARQLWLPDPSGLCTRPEPCAGFEGAAPADQPLDACLTGWTGEAGIELQGHPFLLIANMPSGPVPRVPDALHVYTPTGGARFCLEPQSARSGAFDVEAGQPGGPPLLEPGDELVMSMAIMALDAP